MQPDEKKKLIEKLVDLTVQDTMSEYDMSTSIGYELASRMRQRIRQEQIAIRLKHLDADQVRALLDFYNTDIGKSILHSQSKIDQEIAQTMSAIASEVHHQVIEDLQSGVLPIKSNNENEADH